MLAALGLFIFDTPTALFGTLDRDRSWSHARSERFGALPASQFTGPSGDTLTISGTLVPEICGKYSVLETLAEMGDTGDAYPFCRGDGTILGMFTIERLTEHHDNLIDNGYARSIDFVVELARVADEADDA